MLGLFFLDLTFRIDKNTVNQTSAGYTWGTNLTCSTNNFKVPKLYLQAFITSTDDVYIEIIKIYMRKNNRDKSVSIIEILNINVVDIYKIQ